MLNGDLGDPLGFGKEEPQQVDEPALKVSGRVAILNTEEQEKFYEDILGRYNAYVQHLKNIDEYDLEVESLDFEAETLDRRVLIVGKSPLSVFGANSYLEKCRVKVLKKPFKGSQVFNMVKEFLEGVSPDAKSEAAVKALDETTERLISEYTQKQERYYEEKIKQFVELPRLKKIKDAAEREKATMAGIEELLEAKRASIQKQSLTLRQNQNILKSYFRFFKPATAVSYDIGSQGQVYAVATGWKIDYKRNNPFTPSAVEFQFAVANSIKYLALPASQSLTLNAMKGAYISESLKRTILDNWDVLTKEAAADFTERFIITGNLLQAYGNHRGKLISYTKKDGSTGNGILMPESFDASHHFGKKVMLPMYLALPFIKQLSIGQSIQSTDRVIGLIRQYNGFKILVPASKTKGGKVYMDEKLNELVEGGKFEKSSNYMVALVKEEHLAQALQELQRLGGSVEVDEKQYAQIESTLEEYKPKEVIELPKQQAVDELSLREREAEALALELELLTLNLVA